MSKRHYYVAYTYCKRKGKASIFASCIISMNAPFFSIRAAEKLLVEELKKEKIKIARDIVIQNWKPLTEEQALDYTRS